MSPENVAARRAAREKRYRLITHRGKTAALRRNAARIKQIRGRTRGSLAHGRDAYKKSLVVGWHLQRPSSLINFTSAVVIWSDNNNNENRVRCPGDIGSKTKISLFSGLCGCF